jgi:nucleoside-diphosphate-sugar epimerase
MRVLVTGSAGFIGSHLVRALEARGDDVAGLDIVDSPAHDALDFFRTDNTRYDLAIHCAAVIGGRQGIDGSPLAVATNLALDSWYFNWLVRTGTPRAVYFSSSAAYPVDLQNDYTRARALREDDIRAGTFNIGRPDATYGWAKLSGEQLAEHARAAGVSVLVLRPFSGYGEDQALTYPFPALIRRAMSREDPFDIWGDGHQHRDWIHVDDVISATLAALDAGEQGPLNLGTGVATSFDELAARIIARVGGGYAPTIRHLADKPAGVAYRVADPTRMHAVYKPGVSLDKGIARALAAAEVTPAVILGLPHGQSITRGAATVRRLPLPLTGDDPREVVFSKRYREGKIYLYMNDEAVTDMLPDVWAYAEERLDEAAYAGGGHYLDGRRVRGQLPRWTPSIT